MDSLWGVKVTDVFGHVMWVIVCRSSRYGVTYRTDPGGSQVTYVTTMIEHCHLYRQFDTQGQIS